MYSLSSQSSGCSNQDIHQLSTREEIHLKSEILFKMHLLGLWVLNFLWKKNIPVLVDASSLLLLIINQDAVCSIRTDDQSVDMSQLISLTRDILLDQMVLAILCQDRVNLLGAVPTDIWSKHNAAEPNYKVDQTILYTAQ
jgi:hypothetical protein